MRGAWIEIQFMHQADMMAIGRSPCGERGLKWIQSYPDQTAGNASLPVRGAWIEMESHRDIFRPDAVAPRAGSVD